MRTNRAKGSKEAVARRRNRRQRTGGEARGMEEGGSGRSHFLPFFFSTEQARHAEASQTLAPLIPHAAAGLGASNFTARNQTANALSVQEGRTLGATRL